MLARTSDVLPNVHAYLIANGDFAKAHSDVLAAAVTGFKQAAAWADANRDKVAEALHEVTGVPIEPQTVAANRAQFNIWPLSDDIIAEQQKSADRFFSIGLIPKKIVVKDAEWDAGQIALRLQLQQGFRGTIPGTSFRRQGRRA